MCVPLQCLCLPVGWGCRAGKTVTENFCGSSGIRNSLGVKSKHVEEPERLKNWSSPDTSFRVGTKGCGETGAFTCCKVQGEAVQGGVFIFSIENGKCALAVRALAVCARAARQECCCSLRCASSKELGVAPAHRVGEEYMEHGVT